MLVIVVKVRVVHQLVNDVSIDIDGVIDTINKDVFPRYVVKRKPGKGEYIV